MTAVPNNNLDQSFIDFLPLPEARHRGLKAVLLLDCPLPPTAQQEDAKADLIVLIINQKYHILQQVKFTD